MKRNPIPADQKAIMEAIYTDSKCRSKQTEVDAIEDKVLASLFNESSKREELHNDSE